MVAALEPKPGDTVLDLYCGAGLFAGAVAPLVGPDGAVTGVESDATAVKNARQNLSDYPWAKFQQADAARAVSGDGLPPSRLVIADPPRAGPGPRGDRLPGRRQRRPSASPTSPATPPRWHVTWPC